MSSPPRGSEETELIERLTRRLHATAGPATRVPIGDDAAVVSVEGDLVTSCDVLVEDVHFRRTWAGWDAIGYRAAVATVSDLAAMAVPAQWLLVALGLAPRGQEAGAIADGLGAGIAEAAREYGFDVVGGDLSRSATTFLACTAGGRAVEPPILRSGACEGDLFVVTGALGRGAAALAVLEDLRPGPGAGGRDPHGPLADADEVVAHYLRPRAAFGDAGALRALGARALIDVSDSLAGEARHLANASGISIVLEAARIPVDPAAARLFRHAGMDALEAAIGSGEEYVLCAAVPPGARSALEREASERGWSIAGRFERGDGSVWLERAGGRRERMPEPPAWHRFDARDDTDAGGAGTVSG